MEQKLRVELAWESGVEKSEESLRGLLAKLRFRGLLWGLQIPNMLNIELSDDLSTTDLPRTAQNKLVGGFWHPPKSPQPSKMS